MNYTEMLQALLDGKLVTRKGSPVVYLQKAVVPVYSIPPNSNCAAWVQHRFPMVERDVPYAFSEGEVAATDWRVVNVEGDTGI